MSKTTFRTYDCTIYWARLKEGNRDMGPGDDSDVGRRLTEIQGQYTIDMVVTDGVKAKMIKDGIPEVVLGYDKFKAWEGDSEDGDWVYKAKRPHFEPKFKNEETGEMGIEMGPPNVVDYNATKEAGEVVPFDGLIGNKSKGKVKLSIYKGRSTIVKLQSVGVTDLVEYESDEVFF